MGLVELSGLEKSAFFLYSLCGLSWLSRMQLDGENRDNANICSINCLCPGLINLKKYIQTIREVKNYIKSAQFR